ncbi:MAG TPA: condensation domain-containing protein, partial [Blastocatellia bacterium]
MKDTKGVKGILRGTAGDSDELELFHYLLEEEDISGPESDTIPRREDRDQAPLSSAQQRLWFLEQMEPGSAVYNMPGAMRLNGKIDLPVLERSINEIIRRHEALRTTFTSLDQNPVQNIHTELRLTLRAIDLRELPEAVRESEARRLSTEESQGGFDLERGPLIRARLLRDTDSSAVLLVTMHHIISDGWSLGIFIKELASIYDSLWAGRPAALPGPAIQYADYAAWQRGWLEGEVAGEQMEYWRRHLSGELPVLAMPTDRARPAVQTYRGSTVRGVISRRVGEAIRRVSGGENSTLYMGLLSGYAAVVGRLSGQREVVVGTPVSNRGRRELEEVIGLLVNTLAMRIEVRAGEGFREMMRRVREVALGGYSHGEVPFEKVVEEARPERDLSHTPVFQTMFALQDNWIQAVELKELMMIPYEVETKTSKFDLALEIRESESGLMAVLEYNTDLYDEATAARLLQQYQTLMEAASADPDLRVGDLPMLTPSQRRQLLVEWNDTASQYRRECVHEMVERQARLRPDEVALECEGEPMSYSEMNGRA